jgi:glycosyltransferase involved in cell wall biosynthesis
LGVKEGFQVRILFLTSHFPYPLHSGGALRAYGLIKGVAEAGHEVDLFCFAEIPLSDTPLHTLCHRIITYPPPVRRWQHRLWDIVLTRHADMGRRFWSPEAAAAIGTSLNETHYDIVHAESIEMTAYLPVIHQSYPELPLIYGSLNAEADLQRTVFETERRNPKRWAGAIYSWIQWRRLTVLERHVCQISAAVLAVSEPDQVLLQQFAHTPVALVKNGIDTRDYLNIRRSDQLGSGAIVFTGSMSYRPNVDAVLWFARQILPLILKKHPQAHFYVVGHRPHPRLQVLIGQPHITITGAVEDMQPYWAGAQVYVAPLRMGSGTRFKILEAMAARCAVVSTTIGAQGLGVTSGQELVLADTADDFATAVNELLAHPEKRALLRDCGQAYVQANFDWSVIVPKLLAVYNSLVV